MTIKLSGDQINTLTRGYTWTVVGVNDNYISQTYFRDDGVRFTRSGGIVNKWRWSVREEGLRCVHFQGSSRCGIIANIDGSLVICMQVEPMGDCNYNVTERQPGDVYRLAALFDAQNVRPGA